MTRVWASVYKTNALKIIFQFDKLADMNGEKDLTGGVSNLLQYFLVRAWGKKQQMYTFP